MNFHLKYDHPSWVTLESQLKVMKLQNGLILPDMSILSIRHSYVLSFAIITSISRSNEGPWTVVCACSYLICILFPSNTYNKSWHPSYWVNRSMMTSVRVAEWSKAPDSRYMYYLTHAIQWVIWAFWSAYAGVGSNPTSDTSFWYVSCLINVVHPIILREHCVVFWWFFVM